MPSEGPTKYVPTEEEIKKGEDTMTDAQKELDAKRVESAKKLKKMGVEGYLESRKTGYGSSLFVTGVINGHKVILRGSGEHGPERANSGSRDDYNTVDGIKLTGEEVGSLFKKYKDAFVEYSEKELKDAADVEGSIKRQALKDIGL